MLIHTLNVNVPSELQALEGNLMKYVCDLFWSSVLTFSLSISHRVLCGLANTNRPSALYVGVHKSDRVIGVPLTKFQVNTVISILIIEFLSLERQASSKDR